MLAHLIEIVFQHGSPCQNHVSHHRNHSSQTKFKGPVIVRRFPIQCDRKNHTQFFVLWLHNCETDPSHFMWPCDPSNLIIELKHIDPSNHETDQIDFLIWFTQLISLRIQSNSQN
jgi:hypothetical protein